MKWLHYGAVVPLVSTVLVLALNVRFRTSLALVYLVAVVCASAIGGRGPGLVAWLGIILGHAYLHRELLPWADGIAAALLSVLSVFLVDHVRVLRLRVRELREETRKALADRDAVYLTASYELQGPLATVMLALKDLEHASRRGEGLVLTAKTHQRLVQQIERLYTVVLDLTDFARISAGQLKFSPVDLDLTEACCKVVSTFESDLAKSGSSVHLHTQGAAHSDEVRFRQVLGHLLSNAIKYGAGGRIDVEATGTEKGLTLVVRDQGWGVDPSTLPYIWDRFVRGQSPEGTAGLGLGLWIVWHLTQAQGGTTEVQSTVGEGSTFTIYWPRTGSAARTGSYPALT